MANKHDTIRVRNLEDFEEYPIATGDYLVVATSDPLQKKQTLKASIADVVSVYLAEVEKESEGNGPPTREVELPPDENGDIPTYELDNRDVTVANLEHIAGFGLKVEEFCYAKTDAGVYFSVDCKIPSTDNPNVLVHNPQVEFVTKKLAVDPEEASRALTIQTSGLTDAYVDFISKYSFNEDTNELDKVELPKYGLNIEAGLVKSVDYYIGMWLQYAQILDVGSTSSWWNIKPSDAYPDFQYGIHMVDSTLSGDTIGHWIFKFSEQFDEWQYIGGATYGNIDTTVVGFWFWTETFGWYWFSPKTWPWVYIWKPWKDRDHVGWVYLHHIDDPNTTSYSRKIEVDKIFIADTEAPINDKNDAGHGPYNKWSTRADDPFDSEGDSNDNPGEIDGDTPEDNPNEAPEGNDPDPR